MSGPWEQYGQVSGPWSQYGGSSGAPAAAPQPQQGTPSFSLGAYQGGMHVLDNGATFAKWLANRVPVPGTGGMGLGDAVDNVGKFLGLPGTQDAVQGHQDYIAQEGAKGRVPSAAGRITGEIGATLPTLMLPGGVLAQGAASGGLTTDSSDPRGIATDMGLGAVGGKVGEFLGGTAARGVSALLGKVPAAPTTEALKDAARAAYKQADNSGMIISGNAMRDLTQNIESDLADKGVDATLHPKAVAAYSRIANAATDPKTGGNITLKGLETLRRVAGQAAMGTDPADKFMGHAIQDHIDDFVDALGPQHVIGNLDPDALDALSNARSLWKTASKSDIIDRAMTKAENSASNLTQGDAENAQRTAFRQIANNPKVFGKFNPDEQAAILQVVRGGPMSNAMRQLGKLAPRGVVSAGMDAALGAGTGFGFAPVMLAGEAGRAGASMATQRAANAASSLVRNGGKVAAPPSKNAQNAFALTQAALRALAPPIATDLVPQGQN